MGIRKRYIALNAFGIMALFCWFILNWGFDVGRFFMDHEDRMFNMRLKWALMRGETEIPLRNLTDFEWDEVCPFLPYSLPWFTDNAKKAGTPKEFYEAKILNDIPNLNDDGAWALLFKNTEKKTGYIITVRPRSFSRKNEPNKCYSNTARFAAEDETHTFKGGTYRSKFLSIQD